VQKAIGMHPKDGFYGQLRDAVHAIEEIVKAQQDYQLLSITLMLRRREKDFMLRLDAKYVDKFDKDMAEFRQVLSSSSIDSTTKSQIEGHLVNYQEKFKALVKGMADKGLDAKSGLLGELRNAVHEAEDTLKQLTEEDRKSIKAAVEEARNQALVIAFILIFVVGSVVYFSGRSIVRPIVAASAWISRVRNENDLTLQADIIGEDEVAEMLGNLNSLVADFCQLVSEVDSALGALDGAVSGLSTTAETTQKEMGHQLSETDMVATAVTQMRATIDEIAQNTELAADKSNEANTNAEQGRQGVIQTSGSIGALSDQLSEAGNVVQQLDLDANNIGSVLDVIRNIAEQTNLLALNAAIEAARAGEQGRGFAVVADEVRNLAMRTQESTQEIEQIIQTLQSRTTDVVDLMQQCREKGNDSLEQADKTGELLGQITSDVTMVSDMNLQVATAIEEQSQVAAEVNENLVRIRDIADQSNQNALSIVAVSEQVAEQSNILVRAVQKFKV
jgi:methyl-accepting chemotaxis protein